MVRWFRFLIFILGITVALFAANAYASSDTNQYPRRGEVVPWISDYVISNIHFGLAAEAPSYLNVVELDLDGPASQVTIGFDSSMNQIFTCYDVGQNRWHCDVGKVELSLITNFRAIAVS